jgi:CRISPR/Cas system CMR subunit Cmr4 (Cas7 group RAMP superfamily)
MVADRNGNSDGTEAIKKILTEKPYFQVGGNETIGQGWFSVQFYEGVKNHE